MFFFRKVFYSIIKRISSSEQLENFTGFGLYDQKFLEVIRTIEDPYPYFRGMVMEYGWDIKTIEYTQNKRAAGKSSTNFFTLYDVAMLGFVNHSIAFAPFGFYWILYGYMQFFSGYVLSGL